MAAVAAGMYLTCTENDKRSLDCAVMAVVNEGGPEIDGRSLTRVPHPVVIGHNAGGTAAGYSGLVLLVLLVFLVLL